MIQCAPCNCFASGDESRIPHTQKTMNTRAKQKKVFSKEQHYTNITQPLSASNKVMTWGYFLCY